MRPLQYHHGQVEVQQEANSRDLADHMAHWVGPAAEFAERADLLVFAHRHSDGTLRFSSVSGKAPLVRMHGGSALKLHEGDWSLPDGRVGGLAINLGERRRVRLNGTILQAKAGRILQVDEAFTLCRKYLAPSVPAAVSLAAGPQSREEMALDDPWLMRVVSNAETSFLASTTPDGAPDVAHRGGPAGFLELDPAARRLAWPEYLGDGVFKSAGNVRATPELTLLVLETDTGDAVELTGRGTYTNLRIMRGQRREPLLRDRFDFPTQGRIEVVLESAARLRGFTAPRRPAEAAARVTSRSDVDDQAPQ